MVIKLRFSSFSRCSLIQREPTTYEKPAIPFQELSATSKATWLEKRISLLEVDAYLACNVLSEIPY